MRATPVALRLSARGSMVGPVEFAALPQGRARAPRVDPSGAVQLQRASKVDRKLAATYHPDHNPATAEVMKDLNELWQALRSLNPFFVRALIRSIFCPHRHLRIALQYR